MFSSIKSSLNQLLFGTFMVIGMLTGYGLTHQPSAGPAAAPNDAVGPSVVSTNQRNVLFVAVEQMDLSLTRIEGIWLMMHLPDSDNYSLLPIYPATSPTMNIDYLVPHDPLWLDPQDVDNVEQLTILKEQNIWWNDVVLIDRMGISEMLLAADLVDIPLSVAWEMPREAQNDQAGILQQMCRNRIAFGGGGNFTQLLTLVPGHFKSSMNRMKLIEVWEDVTNGDNIINCEFPSLGF
ncbi:MAG: hypothetical protein DWQ07_03255 [Chloroflexi bacterium]|nr:MAG: hypothetical protein DWQ07_03255 [Chloroflexota bacterium]MBL1193482.1 hypothetical protein [Chloroflexota bacterium]NOH10773.1 hypothetical protein [Chloroflexota bacterium]